VSVSSAGRVLPGCEGVRHVLRRLDLIPR